MEPPPLERRINLADYGFQSKGHSLYEMILVKWRHE